MKYESLIHKDWRYKNKTKPTQEEVSWPVPDKRIHEEERRPAARYIVTGCSREDRIVYNSQLMFFSAPSPVRYLFFIFFL